MASELIKRTMYAGRLELVHNPNARGRAPRYVVTQDGAITKPKGVTTILGQTLSKDLMAWAVACAINYLKDCKGGITTADLDIAATEYERLRDAGASTGTEAHALVEHYLKGTINTALLEAGSDQAKLAYGAFVNWFFEAQPEVVGVEEVIYSLQDEYAGTYDCMLKIGGKVYLCDLKTTNASRKAPEGVYAEYFAQLGAYARAHTEEREYEIRETGSSSKPAVDGLMVISARKDGKLTIKTNEDVGLSVGECGELFAEVLHINRFLNETTKKLGGK
jgi:hypothetical protein